MPSKPKWHIRLLRSNTVHRGDSGHRLTLAPFDSYGTANGKSPTHRHLFATVLYPDFACVLNQCH